MASYGTFQAFVTTADGSVPLAGASVVVTTYGGLTAYRETDRSGKTEAVVLPAPDEVNSLAPDAAGPAFYPVTAAVYREGYERIRVENVQIFPGKTSLQQCAVAPKVDGGPDGGTYVVTPQNL